MTILPIEDSETAIQKLARRVRKARGLVILTRRGKPALLIQDATGQDWETLALSGNPDFVRFINRRRASAKKRGTVSFDEVCEKLDLRPLAKKRSSPRGISCD